MSRAYHPASAEPQSRADCHPAHITSRHAQTQTKEIEEKHTQPSGLCPGAGRRCEDPRVLRNQEAWAEREEKERYKSRIRLIYVFRYLLRYPSSQ